MSKLILLVVAAAWAGVLLPPLLRSRLDARPGSSISSFRRQLSILQRSAPGGANVRSLARPLSGSPRHGYAVGYQPQPAGPRSGTVLKMRPQGHRPGMAQHSIRAHPAPRANTVKQRRQNVLVILAMSTVAFGFLTAVTTANFARYALVLSACLLIGYLYLLVQIRRSEDVRSSFDAWQRAA